jgi:hypothetical protein
VVKLSRYYRTALTGGINVFFSSVQYLEKIQAEFCFTGSAIILVSENKNVNIKSEKVKCFKEQRQQ